MQVSVGTLLAFTTVSISVLVVRYVPPDEFSFPSSLQQSISPVSFAQHSKALRIGGENTKSISIPYSNSEHLHPVVECPLLLKETTQGISIVFLTRVLVYNQLVASISCCLVPIH